MDSEEPRAHRLLVGDGVVTADELAQGDIVYFERVAPNRILVRHMTDEALRTYDGPIFVVAAVDATGVARFLEVSRDDVE